MSVVLSELFSSVFGSKTGGVAAAPTRVKPAAPKVARATPPRKVKKRLSAVYDAPRAVVAAAPAADAPVAAPTKARTKKRLSVFSEAREVSEDRDDSDFALAPRASVADASLLFGVAIDGGYGFAPRT